MKNSGKIILGSFFAIVGVLVFSQFQNCSPATGGSFNIGSAAFQVVNVFVQTSPVTPAAPFNATATLSESTDTNITCSWTIIANGGGQAGSFPPTPIQGSVCYLQNATAPAAGTYALQVTATDSTTNQSAANTTIFTSGGATTNLPSGSSCGVITVGSCSTQCPVAPANCSTNCASHIGNLNYDSPVGNGQCNCGYACQ